MAGATFRWHPIFPSGTVLTKALSARAGGFDQSLAGMRGEDGEFTLRCLYHAQVGAIPEPVFLYRRHATNFSGDQLRNLVDEVRLLRRIRETHAEAAPWHDVIEAEIQRRSIEAANAAFAAGETQRGGEQEEEQGAGGAIHVPASKPCGRIIQAVASEAAILSVAAIRKSYNLRASCLWPL